MGGPRLSILGTAQDAGMPQPNCFCENCKEAISDPAFKRSASSLAIIDEQKWHLIDATPDIKEQIIKLQMTYQLRGKLMDRVFLTHAHLGHFPGLLFLGREAINSFNVPVYAGEKMKMLLENQAPWNLLTDLENIQIKSLNDKQVIQLSHSLTIKALEVPHRNEFSETFAFIIQGPRKKVLYIPDIDQWDDWDIDIHEIAQTVDVCLLDGTFYSVKELEHIGRDFKEIPHPLMTETMDRLGDLTDETDIYFIHLNHSNPALDPFGEVRKVIEERGFNIAEDGMDIQL